MNPLDFLTQFLANDIVFVLVFGAVVFTFMMINADRILGFLYNKSLGHREYIIKKLDLMFVEVNHRKLTATMLVTSFGLGALVFFAVWPNLIIGFIFGGIVTAVGWSVPKYLVNMLFEKRCTKFVDQMVDGVTIMSNGVKSGLSITQSMSRVAENMPNPISQEFSYALSQVRLGLSIEEALNELGTRIPKADVQMLVTAINILKETGGNLAETFATISETIRERQKIQKKIEALTAQGMMQGIIISMVPFGLLIIFLVIDPGYVRPLFTTTLGFIFLFIMLALQITGGLMIRKIVKIEV
jgi:tight adherence protein B